MQPQTYQYTGYASITKVPKNGGHSARVFVPKGWAGKQVVVILLEDIEEEGDSL